MRKKVTELVLIVTLLAGMMLLVSCTPKITANPEYAGDTVLLALGDVIPSDIEAYIDFTTLKDEDRDFVRENSEILLDEKPIKKDTRPSTGMHSVKVNYCGAPFQEFYFEIVDEVAPEFTSVPDKKYTFTGYPLDNDALVAQFEASDNSGDCTVDTDISTVDYNSAGNYRVTATASDASGNKTSAHVDIVVQDPAWGAYGTYVYVSIADQKLGYFENGELVMSSPVVTGNSGNHDTPKGSYSVLNKLTDITLTGMEDDGKTEYESFVHYWMAFIGASYGLHDASWRDSFGGEIYKGNGSHGCVNMPGYAAGRLFGMLEIGTPVFVY